MINLITKDDVKYFNNILTKRETDSLRDYRLEILQRSQGLRKLLNYTQTIYLF